MLLFIYYTYTALSVHCHCVVPVMKGVNQHLPIYVEPEHNGVCKTSTLQQPYHSNWSPHKLKLLKDSFVFRSRNAESITKIYEHYSILKQKQPKILTTSFKMFGNTVIYGLYLLLSESYLFLMAKPAEKPSLQLYLRERYGSTYIALRG